MNTPRHAVSPALLVAALLSAALLSGCATDIMTDRDRAMSAGRYEELEKHALAEVADVRTAKTVKLAPLCMSYAKLKRYDKLAGCLDQFKACLRETLMARDQKYTAPPYA